jgi:glutamate-1-semialdehyde 2,1-aminomutase
LRASWNNYEGLEKIVADNDGQIAGLISTPYHHPVVFDNEMPAEGFWKKVQALCNKKGIVLILDDVRAGFRASLAGSHEYFCFKPDLVCMGKALTNGYPISALVGTDALRDAISSVFFTGTQFFNAAPMAASLATLKELQRLDASRVMQERGKKIMDGIVEIARHYGYDLKVSGLPSMPFLRITNEEVPPALLEGVPGLHKGLHADWISECVQRGAYFLDYHNHFISTAHMEDDTQRTWDIAEDAFKALREKYGMQFQNK